MVRLYSFVAVAALTVVSFAGVTAFGEEVSTTESILMTSVNDSNCFPQVARAIARVSRRVDGLQDAISSVEPHGSLERSARQAGKSLETYFWQVNNTCEREQVRAGLELVRGKVKSLERAFSASAFSTHSEVRSRMDCFMDAYRELVEIVRILP